MATATTGTGREIDALVRSMHARLDRMLAEVRADRSCPQPVGGRAWTRNERQYVARFACRKPIAVIAARLGRSAGAIKNMIFKVARNRRRFNDAELAFVREHTGKMPPAAIADAMNEGGLGNLPRKTSSIYRIQSKLGLSRPAPPRHDTAALDALIRQLSADGWTDAEIREEVGRRRGRSCDRHMIGVRRRAMGLPNNSCNGDSPSRRVLERVRQKTREQLDKAGISDLSHLRLHVWRERARSAGWPEDLRPGEVAVLNALWDRGPLTKKELADAVGVPWQGLKTLHSNGQGGSHMATLMRRGLVVSFRKSAEAGADTPVQRPTPNPQKIVKRRRIDVYMLALDIQRRKVSDDGQQQREPDRERERRCAGAGEAGAAVTADGPGGGGGRADEAAGMVDQAA